MRKRDFDQIFGETAEALNLGWSDRLSLNWQLAKLRLSALADSSWRWLAGVAASSIIIGLLVFIVVAFYIFSSTVNLGVFFYVFLLLSGITDGLFTFIQLPRRRARHKDVSFDPSKVTIIIACYNGQDVIGDTIEQAKLHVPGDQIIVMSDASTDNTAMIARSKGARVYVNPRNINKAFSVSRAMQFVNTPYVMVLDDDTLIGNVTIPTSLMDEGYTAVAFDVMPLIEDTFINSLQQFEYRKSMQVGKNLRSRTGSIGNVSGAIGLFRTDDLKAQVRTHSGQFGGEDEQRTVLAHLYGTGKGITYADETVRTLAPANTKQLMRQRIMKWNVSMPEMFTLYWRVLFDTRQHYMLKAEKAYVLYTYMTDPLRMLFFWVLLARPAHMVAAYVFYAFITWLIWLKTRRQDPFWVVLAFPFYSLFISVCRFFSHFYWLKVKYDYLFRNKFHRVVTGRKLKLEYAIVAAVIVTMWTTSIIHFARDMQLLARVRSHKLEDKAMQYQVPGATDNSISTHRGDAQ